VVDQSVRAAADLRAANEGQIIQFFDGFAGRLGDDSIWERIETANVADVAMAQASGRSTTRLKLGPATRRDMIAGLQAWSKEAGKLSHTVQHRVDHGDWAVEVVTAPLGVVGFVFEGRPNVFADAAGVLATSNAAVLRIGSDALGTATAIHELALTPALREAGLPEASISLVPSRERSAGWALFSDERISLAVTRGSGPAVAALGSIARQSGIPLSTHGTGGAWLIADNTAEIENLSKVVTNSLDRKVCNTLNVIVLLRAKADEFVPQVLAAANLAAQTRGTLARFHVLEGSEAYIPKELFEKMIDVTRANGVHREPQASPLAADDLGTEWEWEGTPEITIAVVDSLEDATCLFNAYSPQFIASLLTTDETSRDWFVPRVNAPFVGNGFTRWVDGQYSLNLPELGLSNWQDGRQLNRSGVLTGGDLVTLRVIATHSDPSQSR
jgi:glutamate-5-semialdehyde dehydrogenase